MIAGKHIAIDAMGGEGGVAVTLPAALLTLESHQDLHLHLVGDKNKMEPYLRQLDAKPESRLHVVHTSEQISETDKPMQVLRGNKKSSIYLATELVENGTVDAMVSAGNTGALLICGRHLLKTIDGIDKPAIVATIPGASRQSFLLDVGANVGCTAEQLFQFAVMGQVLAESLNATTQVRVGLLNIGVEDYKGTEQVRKAAALLEACEQVNYIGYIEGDALFEGVADVVVCDGFVGNVTIKSSAGVANVVKNILNDQIHSNLLYRLAMLFNRSLLKKLKSQLNSNRFNGASLLGLQGTIVKSHGNADIEGFCFALEHAIREVENKVPLMISERVAAIMAQSVNNA